MKKILTIITLICLITFSLVSVALANSSVALSVFSDAGLSNAELFKNISEKISEKLRFTQPPKDSFYTHNLRYQYDNFGVENNKNQKPDYISAELSSSFSQTFISSRSFISSIKFHVSPDSLIPNSIYSFMLRDSRSGQVLANQFFTVDKIEKETEIEIKFLPIAESRNRQLIFSIETSPLQPASRILLRYNKASTQANTSLTVNNIRTSGTITFSVGYLSEPVFETQTENKDTKKGLSGTSSPFIILADYSRVENKNLIRFALYSFKDKAFVYFYENVIANDAVLQETLNNLADILSPLINKDSLPVPSAIRASLGEEYSEIFITWKTDDSDLSYSIYRAETFTGTWQRIGTSNSTSFIDRTALPNIIYWYKIQSNSSSKVGAFSEKVQGYFIPIPKKSQSLDDLLSKKKEKKEVIENREREKIEFSFLGKYFFGSLKLNLAMVPARSYLNHKEVYLLSNGFDFSNYILDFNRRTVFLTHNNKQVLTQFTSNELFTLIANAVSVNDVFAAYPMNKKFNQPALISGWGEPQEGGVKFMSSNTELQFKGLNLNPSITAEIKFANADFISENRLFDFEIYLNKTKISNFYQFGRNTLRFAIPNDFENAEELTISFVAKSFTQRSIIWLSAINFYSHIYDEQLVNKLINNAIFAAVHDANLKATLEDGKQIMIPLFASAGAITEYYKDWRDWKSNALIFQTSDKKLIDKLEKRMKE